MRGIESSTFFQHSRQVIELKGTALRLRTCSCRRHGATPKSALVFSLDANRRGTRLCRPDPSAWSGDSRVCPQIRRQVLRLPYHSAGTEQERLYVQTSRLSHAAGRDGRQQTGTEDLRTG